MKHNYEKRGTDRFLGNLPGVETVPQSIAFGDGRGQHEFDGCVGLDLIVRAMAGSYIATQRLAGITTMLCIALENR